MRATLPAIIFSLIILPLIFITPAPAQTKKDVVEIGVLYLRLAPPPRATLSGLDPVPDDLGIKGAELGIADNNTAGAFLGYRFMMEVADHPHDADMTGVAASLAATDAEYVLLDMTADQIITLLASDATKAKPRLFFNIRARDNALRGEACHADLLHTLPSYAMRADALMQFLSSRKWNTIALLEGNAPEDGLFADAVRNAARKFRLKITADEKWLGDGDLRRAAAAEMPLFTQRLGKYDALIIADEANDFARYVQYNTWYPRPVMGADGLRAVGWSRVFEQWGAAQLQSRFVKASGRGMRAVDYAAWAALRSIDEARTRTKAAPLAGIRAYLLGDAFSLAGFKGRPLSFRNWNGQMRQPVGLVSGTALVATAPIEGFLHAKNELDSLGADESESRCKQFGE